MICWTWLMNNIYTHYAYKNTPRQLMKLLCIILKTRCVMFNGVLKNTTVNHECLIAATQ